MTPKTLPRFAAVAAMAFATLAVTAETAEAQRGRWRGGFDFENGSLSDRRGVPRWEVDPQFPDDLFTFVRVRYSSDGYRGRGNGWATDYPDSDLNFSLRLQQLTSLRVNPDPLVLTLADPRLVDYPFIYMIEPGSLVFDEAEVAALRQYCLNGGFLMIDDFWGANEYNNFAQEIRRVFPDRPIVDVPLEHEIFHCVYDLKEKPQVPSINVAEYGRGRGITWEPRYESDTSSAQYKAISDDAGRIMVFICHNTDLGDGWEREGQNQWYFEEFSVKKSYPMGINIVVYAMTH